MVKDDKGQPVDAAKVSFDLQGGTPKHFETQDEQEGRVRPGRPASGDYKITAEKDSSGAVSRHARPGAAQNAHRQSRDDRRRREGRGGAASAAAMTATLKKAFDDGVALQNAGKHDEAIAKFNEAIAHQRRMQRLLLQHRLQLHAEEGIRQGRRSVQEGDRDQGRRRQRVQRPREPLQRAAEIRRGGEGEREGNANSPRPARRAAAATPTRSSTRASSSGTAARLPKRRSRFEAAIAANPNHAEAHYQLGMALVNEGNMAGAATEFETYLKLAPSGPNAATAKALVDQLKK